MSELSPNYDVSLDFLRKLYPDGPWMLTAISVDKKTIRAKTFHTGQDGKVLAWLESHSSFNLYYSVNRPVESAYAKPKLLKSEIAAAFYLHVDVDPRVGEDVRQEQARILEQMRSYKIRPTFLVFSGGGYNGLWRLEKPFGIADPQFGGSPNEQAAVALAEDLERRNWQLEDDFSTPDHCRDVARILRLPGTLNRPDKKKVEKGRVTALAELVDYHDESYPLSKFIAAQHVSSNAPSSRQVVTSNLRRVESLDELKISEKLKIIIAQGFDPEKHDSINQADRSQYLFFACCELIRHCVPNEVILGIITDSRYGISASVLDKGSKTTRYAMRQLERAHDAYTNEPIGEMNEKYAVILGYGSQTVVMVEEGRWSDKTRRHEPIFQQFRSFKERIKNLPAVEVPQENGKVKLIRRFDWWTSHARRREYESVCFEPGLDTPGRYNLWTGFAVQAVPGDKHERYLEHVFNHICNGDQAHYDYLISWMARVVQFPRTRSMVAPVLLSRERGVGKSVFTDFFGDIFEPHRVTVSDIGGLTGKFNSHLGTSLFVVAEEAFDLRDKRHESVLKEIITGGTIGIERKGVDRIEMPNYTHLIMTSNEDRVVPAGDYERRFFVLRINPAKIQDSDYFGKILDDRRSGGVSNLLHHLMSVDLTSFDVTRVPRTSALQEQQEHNLPLELEWLIDKLDTGLWFDNVAWTDPVPLNRLLDDHRAFMVDRGRRRLKGSRGLTKLLRDEFPEMGYLQSDRGAKIMRFPRLDDCRRQFARNRGWNEDLIKWEQPLSVRDSTDSAKKNVFE